MHAFQKKYSLSEIVIIFEPNGAYSLYLKEFCAENNIKAYILNPKQSHNFARSLGKCSKTDKIDAHTLYNFHKLIDLKDIQVPIGHRSLLWPDLTRSKENPEPR
ncbi:MAG: hypothetical protein E4G94_11650 [ANME-2 cluster archaeon]|nr:MAG: hypothetical protein E4G94_11650 [ANME-2 cluster archaeon]